MSGVKGRTGRKRGKPLTAAEREQRKNAARQTRGSAPNAEQREKIDEAKAMLRDLGKEAAEIVRDLMRDCDDPALRLRAAESIMDRGGLPRRSEHDVAGMSFPLMVVDAGSKALGWPDAEPAD